MLFFNDGRQRLPPRGRTASWRSGSRSSRWRSPAIWLVSSIPPPLNTFFVSPTSGFGRCEQSGRLNTAATPQSCSNWRLWVSGTAYSWRVHLSRWRLSLNEGILALPPEITYFYNGWQDCATCKEESDLYSATRSSERWWWLTGDHWELVASSSR